MATELEQRWAKRRKTVYDSTIKKAKEVDAKLRVGYENRDVSRIEWCKVVSADVAERRHGEIDVLGRPLTKHIADFIVKPLRPTLGRRKRSRIKYISGLPGCGKTFSVLDAVGYLHVVSAKAAEALKTEAEAAKVDVDPEAAKRAATEAANRRRAASRRIAYISGDNFVADPKESLYKALIMAFINDPEVLEGLSNLDYDGDAELRVFMAELSFEEVYIVLDDGNAMDQEEGLAVTDNEKRAAASLFLDSSMVGTADVVICASIRSRLRKVLSKGIDRVHMFVREGFSDLELSTYLSFFHKKETDVDMHRTGRIPRLLACYLEEEDESEFLHVVADHTKALDDFMKKAKESSLMRLLKAATGGLMDEYSDVLDTKCFIRGGNKKAVCLTEELQARAIVRAAQYFNRIHAKRVLLQIERLTQVVLLQKTTAEIGWTAEAAGILSLRIRQPEIELAKELSMKITPQAVTVFRGKLTKSKLEKGETKATLYIPLVFNHKGVDLYYRDLRFFVVGQITVGADPAGTHPSMYLVAERLFKDDPRIKVILWVVVQAGEEPVITAPKEGKDYYEVFMPFGKLDSALALIDKQVKQIRSKKWKKCAQCGIEEDLGQQVQCTECGFWYHVACAKYDDSAADASQLKCRSCEQALGPITDDEGDKDDESEYEEICDEEVDDHHLDVKRNGYTNQDLQDLREKFPLCHQLL